MPTSKKKILKALRKLSGLHYYLRIRWAARKVFRCVTWFGWDPEDVASEIITHYWDRSLSALI